MMNHTDVMSRYADTLARQAEIEGRCRADPSIISALAVPRTTNRQLRILGFR